MRRLRSLRDDDRGQGRMAAMILGVAVAVTIGMVFFAPIVTAVNDNTGQVSVTNETVSADYDNYVDLQGYDIDSGSETVWGYNDSESSYEQASSGSDYEMNYTTGEIHALSGSSLIDDGEEMKVSYTYQASNALTTTVVTFIPVIFAVLLMWKIAQRITKEL